MPEELIGHVTHWYGRIGVAGIHMDKGVLHEGDRIRVIGHTTDFEQQVGSIEVDHEQVPEAHEGQDIGIKVGEHVREHDRVYLVQ
ncbi:MAG: translation elongation factor-like protein [Coriobacteriia bacterium]|nr:translation elongation factor-like protein [Coriobacteriia bacterium]